MEESQNVKSLRTNNRLRIILVYLIRSWFYSIFHQIAEKYFSSPVRFLFLANHWLTFLPFLLRHEKRRPCLVTYQFRRPFRIERRFHWKSTINALEEQIPQLSPVKRHFYTFNSWIFKTPGFSLECSLGVYIFIIAEFCYDYLLIRSNTIWKSVIDHDPTRFEWDQVQFDTIAASWSLENFWQSKHFTTTAMIDIKIWNNSVRLQRLVYDSFYGPNRVERYHDLTIVVIACTRAMSSGISTTECMRYKHIIFEFGLLITQKITCTNTTIR